MNAKPNAVAVALAALALQAAREANEAKAEAKADSKAEAKSAKAAAKASKAQAKAEATASKARLGVSGSDASGFSCYRGERSSEPGWVPGSAGTGTEARKMRASLVGLFLVAEKTMRDSITTSRAKAEAARDARDEGENEIAVALESEAVLAAGTAALEKARARNIRAILDSDDMGRMTALYVAMGCGEVVQETMIACEVGSFGGAMVDGAEAVELAGVSAAPLELSATDLRKRACRRIVEQG